MDNYYNKMGFVVIKNTFMVVSYFLLVSSAYGEPVGFLNGGMMVFETPFFRSLFMFSIPVWLDALTILSSPIWTAPPSRRLSLIKTVAFTLTGAYITVICMFGLFWGNNVSDLHILLWDILCTLALVLALIYVNVEWFTIIYAMGLKYEAQRKIKMEL